MEEYFVQSTDGRFLTSFNSWGHQNMRDAWAHGIDDLRKLKTVRWKVKPAVAYPVRPGGKGSIITGSPVPFDKLLGR